MASLDELEDRVTALEHTTWGVRGDNGMVTALRELTVELRTWQADEQRRRDDQAKEEKMKSRAINAAAVSSVIAMVGVIVGLILVIQGVG